MRKELQRGNSIDLTPFISLQVKQRRSGGHPQQGGRYAGPARGGWCCSLMSMPVYGGKPSKGPTSSASYCVVVASKLVYRGDGLPSGDPVAAAKLVVVEGVESPAVQWPEHVPRRPCGARYRVCRTPHLVCAAGVKERAPQQPDFRDCHQKTTAARLRTKTMRLGTAAGTKRFAARLKLGQLGQVDGIGTGATRRGTELLRA